ncbi:hypothetical protein BDY21DRAFT_323317 [Lineolata rhizophorae]|uniref:NADPH:adrenodoxin oxidoreductase, mitochondrial n=1 Tax=Lineolata rhizophorae TaxID=578093 RepID=A0A6A6NXA1_9PEZI|nr:hypothetical protein BDY21DRAFT_323317 [Lineolata rhizophorae]
MNVLRPARPFTCARCIRRLNPRSPPWRPRRPFNGNGPQRRFFTNGPALLASTAGSASARPLRLAIIGSGPAGFYAALRILKRVPDALVDMYEHLPAPFGLVRYGVAPDHPEVKNCQDRFEEVAESPRFNFIGNVDVGTELPLYVLVRHYHSILFAYGAARDRMLGIPGETSLSGVWSARAFVGWYNGLPRRTNKEPEFDPQRFKRCGETAVVIGNGNVALDVARILLMGVDALRETDISEEALQTLAETKIKQVAITGRRGPFQAPFTIKELRELITLPTATLSPLPPSLLPPDPSHLASRKAKRLAQLLAKANSTPPPSPPPSKNWSLDFFLRPVSFAGTSALSAVDFERTRIAPDAADPWDPAARVAGTAETVRVSTGAAFRSIGYKSVPLPGMAELGVAFDEARGVVPNDGEGRVLAPAPAAGKTAEDGTLQDGSSPVWERVPGLYAAGWVKNGPTGVIASTMDDAFGVADAVVGDWERGGEAGGMLAGARGDGWGGVEGEARKRGLRRTSWEDWKVIDEVERERGERRGKVREKIGSVEEMLEVLDR